MIFNHYKIHIFIITYIQKKERITLARAKKSNSYKTSGRTSFEFFLTLPLKNSEKQGLSPFYNLRAIITVVPSPSSERYVILPPISLRRILIF